MTSRSTAGRRLAAAVAAAAVAVGVTAIALSGPKDSPTGTDLDHAQRTALSNAGAAEPRTSLAPNGWIAAAGIVEPADRAVRVAASEPAVVRQVLVQEGEQVVDGQPLVALDDTVQEAEVERAKAELLASRTQFERLRGGARPEERRAANDEAAAARARAALSKDISQRTATLATQRAATEDEAERTRLQAENDAAMAAAYEERASAVARPWSRDVAVSEASVRQAEAGLVVARARLSLRTIRAPTSGTVLQVLTRAGERTEAAGDALLILGDLSRLRVRLDVDEQDVNNVHTGQRGYVIAPGLPARRFNGAIQEIGLRMGRKNQRTDEPTERIDTKILEAVMLLEEPDGLVQGQRVTGFLKVE